MDADSQSLNLAVFPLDTILFPTTSVPLYIFEPKYLKMVRDSLESGRMIALSFGDPTLPGAGDPCISGYGLPELLEERPDGTLMILLKGKGKAKLGRVISTDPYTVCEARTVPEVTELQERNRFRYNRYRNILVKWLESKIGDSRYRKSLITSIDTPVSTIEFLIAHLVRDPDSRQYLLESNDLNEKLSILQTLSLRAADEEHAS